jgi:hypothetical protein
MCRAFDVPFKESLDTELIHIAQALLHRDGAIDAYIDTTFNFPTRADAYKYPA